MYFVHPQIKFNFNNLRRVFSAFFVSPDKQRLNEIAGFFPRKEIVFTDMGRSAFRLIIERFNLQNSEMLVPAYICDIFYPIFKRYNISPVFLDIDPKTFSIKPEEITRKLTPETKSILVCHTYGLPLNIQAIRERLLKSTTKPLIIEDCAHTLINKTGNSGDASFFSLYKAFPSLRGGMAVLPNTGIPLPPSNFSLRDFISLLNSFTLFALVFKRYGGEIAPKITRKEKSDSISGLNKVSLNLFLNFSDNFEKELEKRIDLAGLLKANLEGLGFEVQSSKNNVFTIFSALVPAGLKEKRDSIVRELRKSRVFCTRIWHTPIILNKDVQKEYKINLNDFPNTIDAAKRIINFPLQNFYSEEDIKKIVNAVKRAIA